VNQLVTNGRADQIADRFDGNASVNC
jgi:hypothetical protein